MAAITWQHAFPLGQHEVTLRVDETLALELVLDGVRRKRREGDPARPRYVWTNVELPFEDHHLVEARLVPDGRAFDVRVTCNGAPVHDARLGPDGGPAG